MDGRIPRAEWVVGLRQFTDRNAGRRTVLVENGSDRLERAEERGYPLRGVAFDPRDGRVEIMLGDQASVDRHLTHSIPGPTVIDVVRDGQGRDEALRIEHGSGSRTILRLLYED